MQTMAQQIERLQTTRLTPVVVPAPLVRRATPPAWPLVIRALLWLYRILFIQPIGRRARRERLAGLSDRQLGDIGLKRVDVHAAMWGGVAAQDLVPPYPSPGPLFLCGRPGFPLTLVRLSEAA